MAIELHSPPPDQFTREQLAELRTSFERAEAERGLPKLPKWYRDLPVTERGIAVVLSKIPPR